MLSPSVMTAWRRRGGEIEKGRDEVKGPAGEMSEVRD